MLSLFRNEKVENIDKFTQKLHSCSYRDLQQITKLYDLPSNFKVSNQYILQITVFYCIKLSVNCLTIILKQNEGKPVPVVMRSNKCIPITLYQYLASLSKVAFVIFACLKFDNFPNYPKIICFVCFHLIYVDTIKTIYKCILSLKLE